MAAQVRQFAEGGPGLRGQGETGVPAVVKVGVLGHTDDAARSTPPGAVVPAHRVAVLGGEDEATVFLLRVVVHVEDDDAEDRFRDGDRPGASVRLGRAEVGFLAAAWLDVLPFLRVDHDLASA